MFDQVYQKNSEEICEQFIVLSSKLPSTRKFLADFRDYAKRTYVAEMENFAKITLNLRAILYYSRHLVGNYTDDLCDWREKMLSFLKAVKTDLKNVIINAFSSCFDEDSKKILSPNFILSLKTVGYLQKFNIGDKNIDDQNSMFAWVYLTGHFSLLMSLYLNGIGDLAVFADDFNSNGYKPYLRVCLGNLGWSEHS